MVNLFQYKTGAPNNKERGLKNENCNMEFGKINQEKKSANS